MKLNYFSKKKMKPSLSILYIYKEYLLVVYQFYNFTHREIKRFGFQKMKLNNEHIGSCSKQIPIYLDIMRSDKTSTFSFYNTNYS
jgi:hypothetical protein